MTRCERAGLDVVRWGRNRRFHDKHQVNGQLSGCRVEKSALLRWPVVAAVPASFLAPTALQLDMRIRSMNGASEKETRELCAGPRAFL